MTIYSPEQVAEVAWRAGFRGDALTIMVAITGAESGYDTEAVGDTTLTNATWGPSIGLAQIRSLNAERGTGSDRDQDANLDPYHNLVAAFHISGGGSNFHPWSTFTNGDYERFMGDAGNVAGTISARGGTPNAWTSAPPVATDDRLQPITGWGNTPTATPDFPVSIRGKALDGRLDDYVVSGSVELDVDQVWQLTFVVDDPQLSSLWASGLFDLDTAVDTAEIHWQVGALEVRQGPANEQVEVTCRTAGAEKAKQDRSAHTESDVTPFGYVAGEAAKFGLIVTGGKVDRSSYAERPSIGRNPANAADPTSVGESAWEAWQRLAKEVGAWCWEGGNDTLFFGAPRRFMADLIGFRVVWRPGDDEKHLAPSECPTCRRTNDDPYRLATITVKLPPSRGRQVRPGMRMTLAGVRGFEDSYIVTKVHWALDGEVQPVEVTAVTPRDPIPTDVTEQETNPDAIAARLVGVGKRANNLDFVNFALKQAGKPYVFGGAINDEDPDPTSFDCSELVEWAAYQVGVTFRRPSGTQYAACQKAGTVIDVERAYNIRGAVLFIGAGGDQHVAISLGDGQNTIEAMGRAYGVLRAPNISTRGFTLAGLIPGMFYNGLDANGVAVDDTLRYGRPS